MLALFWIPRHATGEGYMLSSTNSTDRHDDELFILLPTHIRRIISQVVFQIIGFYFELGFHLFVTAAAFCYRVTAALDALCKYTFRNIIKENRKCMVWHRKLQFTPQRYFELWLFMQKTWSKPSRKYIWSNIINEVKSLILIATF